MSKPTSRIKVESVSDIDAAWATHITAARATEYDKAAGWLTVDDFAIKINRNKQKASHYLKEAYRNGDFERQTVVINGKARFVYRPKVTK